MKNKPSSTHQHVHAHDHYFKMAMQDKRVARDFFEAHLPSELFPLLTLEHLTLESGSYINDVRKESIADMLFKVKMGEEDAYLYLVVDHQSAPDKWMPFRVLKYVCNIIDQHLKNNKIKRIPLIYPAVVYHGKTKWSYSTDINELVDAPKALVDKYFLKPFSLIDLTQIDDAVIKKKIWSGVMELTLKHIIARDIQTYLPDIINLMKEIGNAGGIFTEATLIYILDKAQIDDEEAFFTLIKANLSDEIGEKMMTITERSRIEGKQEKAIEVARHLLASKAQLDIEFIAEATGLSINQVKELKEK